MIDTDFAARTLIELDSDEERTAFFERHREALGPSIGGRLCSQIARLLKVDSAKAVELSAWLQATSAALGDEMLRAFSDRVGGHCKMGVDRNPTLALILWEKAADSFHRLGDPLQEAITETAMIPALGLLGREQSLQVRYNAARETFLDLGDRLRLARLELQYGTAAEQKDRWREAESAYRRAYEEFMVVGEDSDVAVALNNLAVSATQLGNLPKAQLLFEKARDSARNSGFSDEEASIDFNLAYVRFLLGDHKGALLLYEKARLRLLKVGKTYLAAMCDLDESEVLLEICLVEESAFLATRASEVFGERDLDYQLAKSETVLGLCARSRGRVRRAMKLFVSARESFSKKDNQQWCRMLDLYIADLLLDAGQLEECKVMLGRGDEDSLPQLATVTIQAQLLRARLELALGEKGEARRIAEAALRKVGLLDRSLLESQAYETFAHTLEATGEEKEALLAFERSAQALERVSAHLPPLGLRSSFLVDKGAVYESIFLLANRANDLEKAFQCVEKAKSQALAELIAGCWPGSKRSLEADPGNADETAVLRAQLRTLEKQIQRLELSDREDAAVEIERHRKQSRITERKLQRSQRIWESEHFSEHGDRLTVLRTADVRSRLPDSTTLVEYYFARGQLFCFVASRDRQAIVEMGDLESIKKSHRLFCLSMSADRTTSKSEPGAATVSHLRDLHERLLQPLLHRIDGQRLLVVPHGFLHQVPFSALHDGQSYLCERYTVFGAPSMGVFDLTSTKTRTPVSECLVLGVPDEKAPSILEEVESVSRMLPNANLLIGDEVDAESLRRAGSSAQVIHIATHGQYRAESPLFSSIQLGDGSFTVQDSYSLDWSAELVVLSGCATGRSSIQGGDDMFGFARGILVAGTRSLVMSLWSVNDQAAADFITALYRHLLNGDTKDQALASSMNEIRESRPHPYYWAPFTLLGDPGALVLAADCGEH